jgi:hypothetical protein
MSKWEDFRQCPQCTWNFATDEGTKACLWTECPYLPADLDVFCESCRFD